MSASRTLETHKLQITCDCNENWCSFPFSTIASCNLHIENLSTRKLHTANGEGMRDAGRRTENRHRWACGIGKRGVYDFDNCTWCERGSRDSNCGEPQTHSKPIKRQKMMMVMTDLWVERNCWPNWGKGTVLAREGRGEKRRERETFKCCGFRRGSCQRR